MADPDNPAPNSRAAMVVVTPTYAPDLELFTDLHQSVLRWFPNDVRHVAVVNDRDMDLFRVFEGPRCTVLGVSEVLPRSVVPLPLTKLWLNLRRPVPPLRGWILQQIIKLAVVQTLPERVVVAADSDLVFFRPVTVETFAPAGRARLYRLDDGVGESLPRHLRWHSAAHRLLGLPPPPSPPLPDYVSSLNTWDGDVVRRMIRRVEEVTGLPWIHAVGKELHISEWTLYGVYADQFEQAGSVTLTPDSLCHSYWDTAPLGADDATAWLSKAGPPDVAYMISAKSGTPQTTRRNAHAAAFDRRQPAE